MTVTDTACTRVANVDFAGQSLGDMCAPCGHPILAHGVDGCVLCPLASYSDEVEVMRHSVRRVTATLQRMIGDGA